mgnify:CR=1 FL=1
MGLMTADGKRKLGDFEDDPSHVNIPSKKQVKLTAACFKEEMKQSCMQSWVEHEDAQE